MAATVTIRLWTGAEGGPTKTDITGINTRCNAQDAHETADVDNPIRVPAAGTNYSYWRATRLSADTTPTTIINAIKWYSDGANNLGTGVTCKGNAAGAYDQATGTEGTTGIQLTVAAYGNGSTDLTGAPADVFGHTSGSPKSLTGSISNPDTGDFGQFFVFQVEVGTTAGPGLTGTETFTWQYDES